MANEADADASRRAGKPDIFICWSGERSHQIALALVEFLQQKLRDRRKDAIFISDEVAKGVRWNEAIDEALDTARVGIVCLTAENLDSAWLHFEAGALARSLKRLQQPAETSAGAGQSTTGASPSPVPDHRLFTLLHGVTASQLKGPLTAYQATTTTERDMDKLVLEISSLLGCSGKATAGEEVPANKPEAWKAFERKLKATTVPIHTLISELDSWLQRKTFNEPVHRCADQAWLARYEGARITRDRLQPYVEQVREACSPHERGLFEMLLAELDGYGMAIQALLLKPEQFELGKGGELELDEGIRICCEDRRLAIRSLAGRLLHPLEPPLLDDAVRFMAAETNEERKMIVHRLEGRIRREREPAYENVGDRDAVSAAIHALTPMLPPPMPAHDANKKQHDSDAKPVNLLSLRASTWDLDRIYYYLLVQYFEFDALRWEKPRAQDQGETAGGRGPAARWVSTSGSESDSTPTQPAPMPHDWICAARDVEMELERYRVKSKGGSLMPLTYALVALATLCSKWPEQDDRAAVDGAVNSAVTMVKGELGDQPATEAAAGPISRLLNEIEIRPWPKPASVAMPPAELA